MAEHPVLITRIGQRHSYEEVWELQSHLQKSLISAKRSGVLDKPNHILLCEHPPVYTLGKSGDISHLKKSEEELAAESVTFYKINRGGDITYHGPGQVTVYPIFDMDHFYHDLHRYVRELEQIVINVLSHYGILGDRIEEFTGVWIDVNSTNKRKICAIGIHMSRWVSMHGLALNIDTDLSYFNDIIPCGINDQDKTVTSISEELGRTVDRQEVEELLVNQFSEMFGFQAIKATLSSIDQH